MEFGFPSSSPRVVPSQLLYDGAFRVNGNIVLGVTSEQELVSLSVQELTGGCACAILFWQIDPHAASLTRVTASRPLFSRSGVIGTPGSGMVVSCTEVRDGPVRFVVTGQNPNQDEFMYFTVFFDLDDNDKSVYNFSLSVNSRKYRWDPHTSLLLSPVSVVVNCVSSVRMVTVIDGQVKFFQFDVARYLGRILQQSTKFLETYEVDIIEKSEERAAVIVEIGYVFYSEKHGMWYAAVDLVEVPVDGKPVKVLHQETKKYESRLGDQVLSEMAQNMSLFGRLTSRRDERLNYMINENLPEKDIDGIRLVRVPDFNLIIADEKNGKVEF